LPAPDAGASVDNAAPPIVPMVVDEPLVISAAELALEAKLDLSD
jgi:hypothetical protein